MFKIYGKIIHLTKGDTFVSEVSAVYDGEEYVPEENDVITFTVKKDHEDTEPLIQKIVPHDTMEIELLPSETAELEVGKYTYDVDITFADGSKDTFIDDGWLFLTPGV